MYCFFMCRISYNEAKQDKGADRAFRTDVLRGMFVKAASTVNMKFRVCALMVLATGVVLSGCASKPHYDASGAVIDKEHKTKEHRQAQEPQAVRSSNDDQSNSWGDAVMAPLEDLNLRKNDEFKAFEDRINKAVTSIAGAESYDLVLFGPVGYYSPKVDITDRVLKALGKK